MELDFFILPIDEYKVEIRDTSIPTQINPLQSAYTITMDIVSNAIPTGSVTGIDLIPYVTTYKKDRVWYELRSEDLTLPIGIPIPDGIYTIVITINNNITKTHKFCIFNSIKKELHHLIKEHTSHLEVHPNEVEHSRGITEQLHLSNVLLNSLHHYSSRGDEVGCNNTLDKLTRLLTIIKNK